MPDVGHTQLFGSQCIVDREYDVSCEPDLLEPGSVSLSRIWVRMHILPPVILLSIGDESDILEDNL